MQIHELNRKKVKEEVDVSGAGSVFSVGKQVLKNPKALLTNPAMGQAKQDATQAYAAKQAGKLASQGYQVGGAAQTTPQQQLQKVKSNPAVQQMVKSLSAQWQNQSQALIAKLNSAPVTEANIPVIDPSTIKDPVEKQLLAKYYQQQGMQSTEPPAPKVQSAANLKINAFAKEFENWAIPKLNALGVDLQQIMQNPQSAKPLQELLTNVAVATLADPKSDRTNKLIEEFFNLVIATNQTMANAQGRRSGYSTGSGVSPAGSAEDPAEVIKQYGLTIPQGQLDALGQSMRKAAGGGTVIRDTGNELLNAVARQAGFQIGR